MFNFLKRWKHQKRTIRELQNCSDRDLADLGISRADIGNLARQVSDF